MTQPNPSHGRFGGFFTTARFVALIIANAIIPHAVYAQADLAPVAPTVELQPSDSPPESFFEILNAGGVVGYLLIALSLVAAARMVEHIITIREAVLVPRALALSVRKLLEQNQIAKAEQLCKLQSSMLAFVLRAGLREANGGWSEIEKAAEDALAEQSARLYRKIEWLSVIGNIAPMLGLLGTVIGMVLAFREVAFTQGAARAADLAEGIYLALVTTVQGLIVAIPSLGAFAVFRNRVDSLVAETASATQHALAPIKHRGDARFVEPPPTTASEGVR